MGIIELIIYFVAVELRWKIQLGRADILKIDEDNMKAYDFGLRIKERRVMKNFSQKQLGDCWELPKIRFPNMKVMF